jgi:hypothetical protein
VQLPAGRVGPVDVGGLAVALVYRYDDDEPGSPWTFTLHVDERGDEQQRKALAAVFLGELGGPHVATLPWIRKARHLVDVRTSPIELADGQVRVGSGIRLRAGQRVDSGETVTCIVPGHDRAGRELIADELAVADAPFAWELAGNCAYESDFDYGSG